MLLFSDALACAESLLLLSGMLEVVFLTCQTEDPYNLLSSIRAAMTEDPYNWFSSIRAAMCLILLGVSVAFNSKPLTLNPVSIFVVRESMS